MSLSVVVVRLLAVVIAGLCAVCTAVPAVAQTVDPDIT